MLSRLGTKLKLLERLMELLVSFHNEYEKR